MGRVKDWLMSMQSLAEEARELDLDEDQAVQFMIDNMLQQNQPALEDTLRKVYRQELP
jgi:hypothetical protein